MNSKYNYPEMMAWLENKGKLQFGEKFHFREADIINHYQPTKLKNRQKKAFNPSNY
jgi:hypothetical protein